MRKLLMVLAMGLLLLGFGCAQQSGGSQTGLGVPGASGGTNADAGTPGAGTGSGAGGNGSGTPNTLTVHIKNFAFDPADITIKKGDAVVWANDDAVPHSIKSASGAFDSQAISPGSTAQHTFTDAPGAYQYSCGIHPSMHGSITISG